MSADHHFRGVSRGPRDHVESAIKLANSLGIRVCGISTNVTGAGAWPWSRRVVLSQEFRFSARHDDADVLADFVHEIGATRA